MTFDKKASNADLHNVLFVCTGNSARSIMAEAILNKVGPPLFRACSAGCHPKGEVHPEALQLLARRGHDTSGLRSKSWDEFSGDGPIAFDTVITLCNNAVGEICPVIPGRPTKIHWDIPDPASLSANRAQIEQAFQSVYDMLSDRITAFIP